MSFGEVMNEVRWGRGPDAPLISWEEAQRRHDEAKQLAKGLSLVTNERRAWYEETYTEYVVNYFELARLIERVRAQEKKS